MCKRIKTFPVHCFLICLYTKKRKKQLRKGIYRSTDQLGVHVPIISIFFLVNILVPPPGEGSKKSILGQRDQHLSEKINKVLYANCAERNAHTSTCTLKIFCFQCII